MKKIKLLFGILAGVLIMLSTGCQNVERNQLGTLVVKLTDAPFPIDMINAATVTITKVEIRKKSEGNEEGYPFITVLEEPKEFNLLDLRNGLNADLIEMEIEAGSYDLIRLYVDDPSISVKDHGTFKLKVPSGSQTGIKIFIHPDLNVAGGLTTEVLLDFDVEKSFLLQGNMNTPAGIKGFHFKPVIRAVNNSIAGMVEGEVIDADSVVMQDASVWIEQDTVITSAFTDEDGYYAMSGILPGLYIVSAAQTDFDTVSFTNVEIVEGNRTVQNFKLIPSAE